MAFVKNIPKLIKYDTYIYNKMSEEKKFFILNNKTLVQFYPGELDFLDDFSYYPEEFIKIKLIIKLIIMKHLMLDIGRG